MTNTNRHTGRSSGRPHAEMGLKDGNCELGRRPSPGLRLGLLSAVLTFSNLYFIAKNTSYYNTERTVTGEMASIR